MITIMETKFTRTQWITAFWIAAVNFLCSIGISIQAPFYPAEAQRIGASATEYCFVFGSFQIANFVACPLVGKIVMNHEPRRLVACGIIICSIPMILFGFLNRVEDKNLFIGSSIILRVTEAIGAALASVTAFSIVGTAFPNNMGMVMGIMEMVFGAGLILGPAVGGLLFELGGFSLPFISAGMVGTIIFLMTLLLIPRITVSSTEQKETYEIASALKIPGVVFYTANMILSCASEGFYMALLTTHLSQFNLSPEIMSLFFVIVASVYTISTPFFGRALDSGAVRTNTMLSWACIFAITAWTLIGPAPYLHFQLTIPICIVALLMLGLSFGVINITAYAGQLESARKAKLEDGPALHGLISGIWTGTFTLGNFIGSISAGILYDHYGFRLATQFFVAAYIIQLIGTIIFERITRHNNSDNNNQLISGIDECTPILKSTSG